MAHTALRTIASLFFFLLIATSKLFTTGNLLPAVASALIVLLKIPLCSYNALAVFCATPIASSTAIELKIEFSLASPFKELLSSPPKVPLLPRCLPCNNCEHVLALALYSL